MLRPQNCDQPENGLDREKVISMKRDMDLIRKILVEIEESSIEGVPEFDGYEPANVAYHCRLLLDAGLITAADVSSHDGEAYLISGLTWAGHDFLDAARNETVWNKAKEVIKSKGGGFTFDILKLVLKKLLTEHILGPGAGGDPGLSI
jgi:hypothetical protein